MVRRRFFPAYRSRSPIKDSFIEQQPQKLEPSNHLCGSAIQWKPRHAISGFRFERHTSFESSVLSLPTPHQSTRTFTSLTPLLPRSTPHALAAEVEMDREQAAVPIAAQSARLQAVGWAELR